MIHDIESQYVSRSGWLSTERNRDEYLDERPADRVRVLIEGTKNHAGFGLSFIPAGRVHNDGRGGFVAGPHLSAYGLATVIDNHGGTGAEIEQAELAGLVVRAKIGDVLVIDRHACRIEFAGAGSYVDRHNVKLVPVTAAVAS